MCNMYFKGVLLCIVLHLTRSDKVDDYFTRILKLDIVLHEFKAKNQHLTQEIKQLDTQMSHKFHEYERLIDFATKGFQIEAKSVNELKHKLSSKYLEEADLLVKVNKKQQHYALLEQDLATLKQTVVLMEKRKKQGKDKTCKRQLIATMGTKMLQPRSINRKKLDELKKTNVELYRQNLKRIVAEVAFNKASFKMLTEQLKRKQMYYTEMKKDMSDSLRDSLTNKIDSQKIINLLKLKVENLTKATDLLRLKLTSLREAMEETEEEIDELLPVMKKHLVDSVCYGKLERQVVGRLDVSTIVNDMFDIVQKLSNRPRVHDMA